MKKAFYLYQRGMWYLGTAVSEARKPLIMAQEAAIIGLFLKVFGLQLTIWQVIIAYLVLSVMGVGIGKLLVHTGIVAYNASLSNQQSPELMQIIKKLDGRT